MIRAAAACGLAIGDLLLNSLTSGLFLVTAVGELVAPDVFIVVAKVAYPVALALLVANFLLIMADPDHTLRYRAFMRMDPGTAASLLIWRLTVPLIVLTVLSLSANGGPRWARLTAIIAGLPSGLACALSKGAWDSSTSKLSWPNARWLGSYLASSSLLLGGAQLLALSIIMDELKAAIILRAAVALFLLLNVLALGMLAAGMRATMVHIYSGGSLAQLALLTFGVGVLAPLGLLLTDASYLMLGAVLLILLGAIVVRLEIVRLLCPPPDSRGAAPQSGPERS